MSDFLTAALPGTAGTIGDSPTDFFVEEIPLYEPSDEGEHLYLTVEKQGLTTYDLLNRVAAALGARERDLGYAGLKDARAVTRQTISVPGVRIETGLGLRIPGVQVLSARLHTNKLRPGHLAGNFFRIRIFGTADRAVQRAEAIFQQLQDQGVPNRFGRQRFGVLGNSHRVGRALLQKDFTTAVAEIIGEPEKIVHPAWKMAASAYRDGDYELAITSFPKHCRNERQLLEQIVKGRSHRQAVHGMPRKLLRLYLSAYQSALFDRLVLMRLDSLGTFLSGDLAYKHVNGASFIVEDPAVEQPRADQFEISPSGPLYGYKVRLAEDQAGLLEHALLDKEQLQLKDFRLGGGLSMEGARRPLRVPLLNPLVTAVTDGIQVSFQLPKGSFATTVLHEIMKVDARDESLAGVLH
jgi:tRNA pseudouridine13 synthase